ncbi:MAG: DNA polymerase III subunit delta [bacterium]
MIYAICSNDQYRLIQEGNKLVNELNIPQEDIFKFNATDISEGDLLQELCTTSLFGQKCIVVNHPVFLENDYKFTYKKDFINYFTNPTEDIILILLIDFNFDKNNDLIKLIYNHTKINCLVELNENDLSEYINKLITQDNYTIENVALEELIRRTQSDTLAIGNEIDKLKMYCDNKKITFKDVCDLVVADLDKKIYELTNYYFSKNTKMLMQTYYDIVKYGNKSDNKVDVHSSIVSSFNTNVTTLIFTKNLIKKGQTKNEIAEYFKVKPGKAHYMVVDANKITDKKLLDLLDRLTKLDLELKTTTTDRNLAVELFLLSNE